MDRLLLAFLISLAACGGDTTQPVPPPAPPPTPPPPPPPPPPPAPVASITVDPGQSTLVPQQTTQFTATLRDAGGNLLTGRTVTWTAAPSAVASVSAAGVVTAAAAGQATVTAASEGQSGQATVTVLDGGFVGPAGASIVAAAGAVTLEVPAGAVTTGTALTVASLAEPPADPRLIPGTAYTFGPEGTPFNQPVTVRIRYETPQVPAGAEPERFGVFRWTGTEWMLLPNRAVDVAARTVSGRTTAFSAFAVIELSPNPLPAPALILPNTALAGGPGFTMRVTGEGFVDGAEVRWNGFPRPTTFLSATELAVEIERADIGQPDPAEVTVVNPPPGGGSGAAGVFRVTTAAVAAGGSHSCNLLSGGTLRCWGDGAGGQLGDGAEPVQHVVPVPVSGENSFVAISVGSSHTCAVTTAGIAHCWGSNRVGSLGVGNAADQAVPAEVHGGHTVLTLSAGRDHSCLVAHTQIAYCWGRGGGGQLGIGVWGLGVERDRPTATSGGHAFTAISAGRNDHTCGITISGAAYCWGTGTYGQLGNGLTNNPAHRNVPTAVSGGLTFATITTGQDHTCALTPEGAAYCWGNGTNGQIGNGDTEQYNSLPVPVAGGLTFTQISAGYFHTCALTEGGAVYCWGNGASGALGNGSTTSSSTPVAVDGGPLIFAAISAGSGYTCGVTNTGAGYCWGSGTDGKLGTGSTQQSTTPAPVADGHIFTAIAAGLRHTCGVTAGGSALCWGNGPDGELGNGSTTNRYVATPVTGNLMFFAASGGVSHTCAIAMDGQAYCWGSGSAGRLGTGSNANQNTPTPVAGTHRFSAIAAGSSHSCGIAEWRAYCWGERAFGRLGDGSTSGSSTVPVAVQGNLAFATVSTGAFHSCALTPAGAAYCWGVGASGQLGHGSGANSPTPVAVAGGHIFAVLASGSDHTCGITIGGATYCWGSGFNGKLGNGLSENSHAPTLVSGGHTFIAIAAGINHTCGVTAAGPTYCWGQGIQGQLGNGAFTPASTLPTLVGGGHGFETIVAGSAQTCAATNAGATFCWGRGTRGMLGNGEVADRNLPVAVVVP